MMEPVRSEDCRLLLSLLKYAIVPPDQLERVETWIRAKEAALSGMGRMEKEFREMHVACVPPETEVPSGNGAGSAVWVTRAGLVTTYGD